jgi:hypothetical protein
MRRYWKLKEEELDRAVWRTRFGRGYGPVVKQCDDDGDDDDNDDSGDGDDNDDGDDGDVAIELFFNELSVDRHKHKSLLICKHTYFYSP